MLHALDHVIIGVSDLDAAARTYAALLGREASWRGVHPGYGTANALYRLANGYVELLAPAGDGAIGAQIAATLEAQGEGMLGLAFATDDAAAFAERTGAAPPAPGEGRDEATGAERRWKNSFLPTDVARGLLLFAIEHDSPPDALPLVEPEKPAAAPDALDHVVIASPDLEGARALYGDRLGLRLALDRSFEQRGLRMLFFRVGGVTVEVVGRLGVEPDPAAPDAFGGIAYRVPDAEATRARLAEAGFDVSEVRDGHKPGTQVCTVRAETHGVPTLLIQPQPR